MTVRLIAIGGVARSGKDTLFKYISTILPAKRVDLAYFLKDELNPLLTSQIGISAFTSDSAEKSLIRDFFVAYAKIRRGQTGGKYFMEKAQPKINEVIYFGVYPVVTDCRYEDEISWVKGKNQGILIHVSRLESDGSKVSPPNKDEMENDPKVEKSADLKIVWPTLGTEEEIFIWADKHIKKDLLNLLGLKVLANK